MNILQAWTERCGSALDRFSIVSYMRYEYLAGMACALRKCSLDFLLLQIIYDMIHCRHELSAAEVLTIAFLL